MRSLVLCSLLALPLHKFSLDRSLLDGFGMSSGSCLFVRQWPFLFEPVPQLLAKRYSRLLYQEVGERREWDDHQEGP